MKYNIGETIIDKKGNCTNEEDNRLLMTKRKLGNWDKTIEGPPWLP